MSSARKFEEIYEDMKVEYQFKQNVYRQVTYLNTTFSQNPIGELDFYTQILENLDCGVMIMCSDFEIQYGNKVA